VDTGIPYIRVHGPRTRATDTGNTVYRALNITYDTYAVDVADLSPIYLDKK